MLKLRPFMSKDVRHVASWFDETDVVGHITMRFTDKKREEVRFGFIAVKNVLRGRGYGSRMLRMSIRYAFDFLHARKITLGVFENNIPARRCYEAVGFREVPGSNESFLFFGENWKCIEMEINNLGGGYGR